MRIIPGWEQAASFEDGVERIPAGGHVCRIVTARVETIDNGSEKLSMALEIEDGSPLDGVCRRMFAAKSASNPNAKWPCVLGQFLTDRDGQCSPYFKGLIKCVEKSNPGYQWAWDEKSLKGKLIGVIFREEEYIANDGTVRTIARPAFARSVERIREGVEVPEVKRLPGSVVQGSFSGQMAAAGFVEVPDEALPF